MEVSLCEILTIIFFLNSGNGITEIELQKKSSFRSSHISVSSQKSRPPRSIGYQATNNLISTQLQAEEVRLWTVRMKDLPNGSLFLREGNPVLDLYFIFKKKISKFFRISAQKFQIKRIEVEIGFKI